VKYASAAAFRQALEQRLKDEAAAAAIRNLAAAQQIAMDDFFTFAATRTDELDDADEFSAVRFHVTAQLAGRTFEQFLVDIAFGDTVSWTPDTIQTSDLLSFAGIEPLALPAIPLPEHLAEKVHAYTRTYGARGQPSTRPKDLVDILLIELGNDRCRLSAARAGEHLCRACAPAPAPQPPAGTDHVGRPRQTPGRDRPRGDRPLRRVCPRRRRPRSRTRRATQRWRVGQPERRVGHTGQVTAALGCKG
jgi:Nucleotidyl transferase AbiEii toxin, Type IV TA system